MNINSSLRQSPPNSATPRRTQEQQIYCSRLRSKAETLLRQQSKGKYLDNQQRRLVQRWQRVQLVAAAAGVAA